jgi:hypothetical protein
MDQDRESVRIVLEGTRPHQADDFSEDRVLPRQMPPGQGANGRKMVVHSPIHFREIGARRRRISRT